MDVTEKQVRAVADAIPAIAPVCRTVLKNRLQMRAMEREKDAELEVIQAKQELGDDRGLGAESAAAAAADRVEQQQEDAFAASIDRMKQNEDCELCSRLLSGIARVDPEDRAVALSEYGRFKQAVDDTEDVDTIREEIEGMEVLEDVMLREFNMNPSE